MNHPLDLLLPADNRVQAAHPGQVGEIPSKFFQIVCACRRPGLSPSLGLGLPAAAALRRLPQVGGNHLPQHLFQPGAVRFALPQHPHRGAIRLVKQGEEDMLGPRQGLAGDAGLQKGVFQDALAPDAEVPRGEGGEDPLPHHSFHLGHRLIVPQALLGHKHGGHAGAFPQQSQKKMLAAHIGVAHLLRRKECQVDGVVGLGTKTGKFIHRISSPVR